MKKLLLKGIRLYQRTIIFHVGFVGRLFMTENVCRFIPTCSQYMYEAVEEYGVLKGVFLGLKRLSHCHPWNKGGYDPLN